MSTNKPFIPNIQILKDFVEGDIKITEAFLTPVLSSIGGKSKNDVDNKLFEEQSKNATKGFKSLEKTIVSTFYENQKPIIEGVLLLLDLFAALELTKAYISGGKNPMKDPESFTSQKAANTETINQISKQDTSVVAYPETILLCKFDSNNNNVDINLDTPSYYGTWEKYTTYEQLVQLRRAQHEKDFSTFTPEERNNMFNDRLDMISQEYQHARENNQIKDVDFIDDVIKFTFDIKTINYQGKEVQVDIDSDYRIEITKEDIDSDYKHFTYYAIRKQPGEIDSAENLKSGPDFIPSDPAKAIKIFLKQVIPLLSKKLIAFIKLLQKIISDPANVLLIPLTEKLKDKFEFLDPSLKNKPKTDKLRSQYYDTNDKFILDGSAKISLFSKEIGLTIKNGDVSKFDSLDVKEQPLLNTILSMAKMPFEMIKGFIDTLLDLIKSLMKFTEIPNKFTEFISFEWLKKLISPENLLKFIGSTDGTIMTLPFLKIPASGDSNTINEMIKTVKSFISAMFTSFITLIESMFNVKLGIKISI